MLHCDQWFVNRFIDETVSNNINLSSISEYQNQLLLSLKDALGSVYAFIDGLADYNELAEERCPFRNRHWSYKK